jgi:hypothetical protein
MTWQEAYTNFEPLGPLQVQDPRLQRELFVPHLTHVVEKLVLNRNRNFKMLLSSHVGAGKSTFLNVLAEEPDVRQQFFVSKLMLSEFADPNDIDHLDILLGIALNVVQSASEAGVKFDAAAVKQLREMAKVLAGVLVKDKTIDKSRTASVTAQAGVGIPSLIKWLNANFVARFHLQHEVRESVREHYKLRITEFIDALDVILASVRTGLAKKYPGRELLVLVDDTDKPLPMGASRELFSKFGDRLAKPKVNIIYVVAAEVSCWRDYRAVVGKFGDEEFMPAVKVDTTDGLACMYRVLRPRATEDVISKDMLEELVKLGGGHARETIRLCREAVFAARGPVGPDHVETAQRKLRNEFNPVAEDLKVLRAISRDERWVATNVSEEETFFSLLHQNFLLQYRNGEIGWYRPLPYLKPWLEEHR